MKILHSKNVVIVHGFKSVTDALLSQGLCQSFLIKPCVAVHPSVRHIMLRGDSFQSLGNTTRRVPKNLIFIPLRCIAEMVNDQFIVLPSTRISVFSLNASAVLCLFNDFPIEIVFFFYRYINSYYRTYNQEFLRLKFKIWVLKIKTHKNSDLLSVNLGLSC